MTNQSPLKAMLQGQIFTNKVQNNKVMSALGQIAREGFLPAKYKNVAYVDEEIALGNGRYMPQPLIFAQMLQLADIQKNQRVLDIASGMGYTSAVISVLAKEVVALESDAEFSTSAAAKFKELGIKNITCISGDLLAGAPEFKPYDVILIQGAVQQVPDVIFKQLKTGGKLICVENADGVGNIVVMKKAEKTISKTAYYQAYAPVLEEFKKPAQFNF